MVAAAVREITEDVGVGGGRLRRTGVAGRTGIQPHCGIHRLGHPAAFGRAETRSARASDRWSKEDNTVADVIDASASLAYDARVAIVRLRCDVGVFGVKRLGQLLVWVTVAMLGAAALGKIALDRGESLNAIWFVSAAVVCYLVAYRVYSAFLAARLLALDDTRATPSERNDDGRDFVPTSKWVLFGHHFAAIAGPGPLVGPTLAAQFGYLPGTLWLIACAAFAGCVQDFIILFCSIRRDGKSIGQMALEEVSERGGFIAQLAVLAIMVILLGVIALVVVTALKSSPGAAFTCAMPIPIALLIGVYLRFVRPGRVLEGLLMGVALI